MVCYGNSGSATAVGDNVGLNGRTAKEGRIVENAFWTGCSRWLTEGCSTLPVSHCRVVGGHSVMTKYVLHNELAHHPNIIRARSNSRFWRRVNRPRRSYKATRRSPIFLLSCAPFPLRPSPSPFPTFRHAFDTPCASCSPPPSLCDLRCSVRAGRACSPADP